MFRQQLLPCACLTLALGVAVVAAAPKPSWGQDRSTEERLDRLERDLNMLQRQVYQGGPPPAMSGDGSSSGGGSAVDVEVRMERVEQQMRDLTGRFEEVVNQVNQLKQHLDQVNSDIDMRLGSAGSGPGSGPLAAANPAPPRGLGPAGSPPNRAGRPPFPTPSGDSDDEDLRPPSSGAAPGRYAAGDAPPSADGNPADSNPNVPMPIFGTLTPPGSAPSPPAMANAAPPPRGRPTSGDADAASAGGLPDGSPVQQYDYAFDLVKKADYSGAETALKAFVAQHPNDRNAGPAQYWLGETYFTRGRYLEAASAFAEGYKRYPKSPKAPDDLLKLGMALAQANQKQNACLALSQLDHDFPHAGAPVKERAARERTRLGC